MDLEITYGEGESSMASCQGGSSTYEPSLSTQAIRVFVGESEDLIAIPEVVIRAFVASDDLQSLGNRAPRMRRKMAKRGQKQEDVHNFPVELLERIFCRIPFPAVFKVRLLAKEWLNKFPVPSLESLDPCFPNLISSVSSEWNKYSPVISIGRDSLLCFDQTSFQWRQMRMFLNLPEAFHRSVSKSKSGVTCSYAFSGSMGCIYNYECHYVMVCNTITKVWRRLPKLPKYPLASRLTVFLPYIQMMAVNSDTYKVVLVYTYSSGILHIYDSKSGVWIEVMRDQFRMISEPFSTVHIGGRLYWIQMRNRDFVRRTTEDGISIVLSLEAYLAEDYSWLKTIDLQLPWSHSYADMMEAILDADAVDIFDMMECISVTNCGVFKCKDKFVVVIQFHDHIRFGYGEKGLRDRRHDNIAIYHLANEIDLHEYDCEKKLDNIKRKPVLDWPQPTDDESDLYKYETKLFGHWLVDFSADDNFIYVVSHERCPNTRSTIFHVLLAYHLDTRTWSQIPSPPTFYGQEFLRGLAFQPGLYPFMSV